MRLLFVTARFPFPPFNGDSHRVYHQIRELNRDHRITLLSISDTPVTAEDYAEVAPYCERVEAIHLPRWRAGVNLGTGLVSRLPLQIHYYRMPQVKRRIEEILREGDFDLVHATLIRVAPYVWDIDRPPVVIDMIDSLALSLGTRRGQIGGPKRLAYDLEYRRVREYESAVVGHFPGLIVISENDRKALRSEKVSVVSNGVDLDRYAYVGPEGREPATLVFAGNMGYDPNEKAMAWFARQVWPSVRAERTDARLQIVGVNPSEAVRALAEPGNGIEVLGRVPDVIAYLEKATVAICPMQTGSGMLNKVLEALSVGPPLVATSVANAGVGAVPGRDLLVADTPGDFAGAVLRLLEDPGERARIARNGRTFVEQTYTWQQHVRRLLEVYDGVLEKARSGVA